MLSIKYRWLPNMVRLPLAVCQGLLFALPPQATRRPILGGHLVSDRRPRLVAASDQTDTVAAPATKHAPVSRSMSHTETCRTPIASHASGILTRFLELERTS